MILLAIPMKTKLSQLLTAQDVCDKLRISRNTLAAHMKNGELDYIKIGKSLRFSEFALVRFIDAKTQKNSRQNTTAKNSKEQSLN